MPLFRAMTKDRAKAIFVCSDEVHSVRLAAKVLNVKDSQVLVQPVTDSNSDPFFKEADKTTSQDVVAKVRSKALRPGLAASQWSDEERLHVKESIAEAKKAVAEAKKPKKLETMMAWCPWCGTPGQGFCNDECEAEFRADVASQ